MRIQKKTDSSVSNVYECLKFFFLRIILYYKIRMTASLPDMIFIAHICDYVPYYWNNRMKKHSLHILLNLQNGYLKEKGATSKNFKDIPIFKDDDKMDWITNKNDLK